MKCLFQTFAIESQYHQAFISFVLPISFQQNRLGLNLQSLIQEV